MMMMLMMMKMHPYINHDWVKYKAIFNIVIMLLQIKPCKYPRTDSNTELKLNMVIFGQITLVADDDKMTVSVITGTDCKREQQQTANSCLTQFRMAPTTVSAKIQDYMAKTKAIWQQHTPNA